MFRGYGLGFGRRGSGFKVVRFSEALHGSS